MGCPNSRLWLQAEQAAAYALCEELSKQISQGLDGCKDILKFRQRMSICKPGARVTASKYPDRQDLGVAALLADLQVAVVCSQAAKAEDLQLGLSEDCHLLPATAPVALEARLPRPLQLTQQLGSALGLVCACWRRLQT